MTSSILTSGQGRRGLLTWAQQRRNEGKAVASGHILRRKAQGVEDPMGQGLLEYLPGPRAG